MRRSSCSSTGTRDSPLEPLGKRARLARPARPPSPRSVSGSPTTTRSAPRSSTSRRERREPALRVRPLHRRRAAWRACPSGPRSRSRSGPTRGRAPGCAHQPERAARSRRARRGQRLGQLLGIAAAGLRHRVAAASAAARDLRPPRARRRRPSRRARPPPGAKFATRCTRPSTAVPSTTAASPSRCRTASDSVAAAPSASGALDGLDHHAHAADLLRACDQLVGHAAVGASPFGLARSSLTRSLEALDRAHHLVLGHPQQRRDLAQPLGALAGTARAGPGPVTASMRRTFDALEVSVVRWKSPISAVAATWVPPHSSRETPSTSTMRTQSPYFSPNSAIAPSALGLVARGLDRAHRVVGRDPAVHEPLDRRPAPRATAARRA